MKVILCMLFVGSFIPLFYGQCTVQGSVAEGTVACNECVALTANGFGENTEAFIENFNSGQPVGWQFTQTVTVSSTTCGPMTKKNTTF